MEQFHRGPVAPLTIGVILALGAVTAGFGVSIKPSSNTSGFMPYHSPEKS